MRCVFCGNAEATTQDHVPPKSIFPKPRPGNLITVPSCEECNAGASKDDEYFRFAISMNSSTGSNPQAARVRDSSVRSLKRDRAAGFRNLLAEASGPVDIKTVHGIIIGQRYGFEVQLSRLFTVLQRIVRGLFYHEAGFPLDTEYVPLIHSRSTIDDLPAASRIDLQNRLIAPLWALPAVEIGSAVFSYRHKFFEEDQFSSVWGLTFYEALEFVAITIPVSRLQGAIRV